MGGACCAFGGEKKLIQGLVGKSERKGRCVRLRRRWEDNIKVDLQEVGCGDMVWIELARDRDWWQALVNAVMDLRVSKMRGIS